MHLLCKYSEKKFFLILENILGIYFMIFFERIIVYKQILFDM